MIDPDIRERSTDGLRRILSATFISLFGQAVSWTASLLLTAACGRFLGDAEFGKLNLANSFVMLVVFPIEFAFNQQLIREVAQSPQRAPRYVASILLLKGAMWILLYGVILVLASLLHYGTDLRVLIAICGVGALIGSATSTFSACHYAVAQVAIPAAGGSLEKLLAAVFGVVILRQGAGVVPLATLLLLCAIANAAWQGVWLFRRLGRQFSFDASLLRQLLSTSLPFLIYAGLGVVYYRIDTVLLFQMTDAAAVGWYTAGYRLLDALFVLPAIVINTIMYPTLARLAERDPEATRVAIEKCCNVLLVCGFPLATALLVGAPTIVRLVYGRAEFAHTIPVLRALAPGLVLLYVNSVLMAAITSAKREAQAGVMAGMALLFNVGLNLVLIPAYRQVGAAVVTSLTELLLLGLGLRIVPRQMWPRASVRVAGKAALASAVMGTALWWFGTENVIALVLVSPLLYLAAATLLGTIPASDVRQFLSAVQGRGATHVVDAD
ncbi:MAG TPA: flippase [Candidatus Acidoferrales bacterium]|nr:flippase [Candidatus Acidoferrales bacterium]